MSKSPSDEEVEKFVLDEAERQRDEIDRHNAEQRREQERISRIREEHPYAWEDYVD